MSEPGFKEILHGQDKSLCLRTPISSLHQRALNITVVVILLIYKS